MRNFYDLKKIHRSFLLLLVFGLLFQACRNVEELSEDLVIYVDTDVVLNPLTLQVTGAEPGQTLPDDIQVRVLGEDKDRVYSVLGERGLTVDRNLDDPGVGIVQVGVRKIEAPAPDDPVDFTLVFEAPGYRTLYRSFSLVEGENRLLALKMQPEDASMDGVDEENRSFEVGNQGAGQSIRMATQPTPVRSEMVEMEMTAGTRVYDQDGQMLSGQVEAKMMHYDLANGEAANAFPGGQMATLVRDVDGQFMGNLKIRPIGAFTLDMFVGGKEVRSFSDPVDVTFHISDDIINPVDYQPIKAGDEVSVFSLNEATGEWDFEKTAEVTRDAYGDLVVRYQQPHLSAWVLGLFSNCGRGQSTRLDITSGINVTDPHRFFYSELIRVENGTVTGERIGEPEFFRYYNGERIFIVRGVNEDAVLRIYNGFTEDCKHALIFESAPFSLCGGSVPIDLGGVITNDDFLTIHVNVRGTCSSEFNDLVVLPTLPILFRQSGCESWSKLGTLISGTGSTSSLEKGGYYDFRISYRELDRCLLNVQVPTRDSTIQIESPVYDFYETVEINYVGQGGEADGKVLNFNYTDIAVPDLACQEFIDAFGRGSTISRPSANDDD